MLFRSLILTSPSNGLGSATITYAITANPTCQPRTGILSISGLSFMVVQAAKTQPGVIHVNLANIVNGSDGSSQWPFRTVRQGYDAACNGDTLRISNGNYQETFTITKALRVEATNGIVHIGR